MARRVELRPVQSGAEDTEERVLTLVFPCPLWRAILPLGQPTAKAGYMVKSMRLTPTNKVGQARKSRFVVAPT